MSSRTYPSFNVRDTDAKFLQMTQKESAMQ